jgi:predicted nucleic acid-binding Zn finger protein
MVKRKCNTPVVMGRTCDYVTETGFCSYRKGCSCQVPKPKYIAELEGKMLKEITKVFSKPDGAWFKK